MAILGQETEKTEEMAWYLENMAKLYLNFGTNVENIQSQITLFI